MNESGIDSAVVFKALERIADRWQLSILERCGLLGTTRSTYARWMAQPAALQLSGEQLRKISYLINIYDGLHRLFGDPQYADEWLRIPNAAFRGKAPLTAMLSSERGLRKVHEYLQSALAI